MAIAFLVTLFTGVASAEEMHGAPPMAGTQFIPTPRFICLMPGMLDIAFRDSKDIEKIHAGLQAAASILINDQHVCFFVHEFSKPLTVIESSKIGQVILYDESEFDAHAIHMKADNGLEIWALWLEMTKDAPKVEYMLKCTTNDCA